jgi:hypothetical protein
MNSAIHHMMCTNVANRVAVARVVPPLFIGWDSGKDTES